LTIDECGILIFDVRLLGADAHVQAHIANQQSSIGIHQSSSCLEKLHTLCDLIDD
jgi:hypothetical protein